MDTEVFLASTIFDELKIVLYPLYLIGLSILPLCVSEALSLVSFRGNLVSFVSVDEHYMVFSGDMDFAFNSSTL